MLPRKYFKKKLRKINPTLSLFLHHVPSLPPPDTWRHFVDQWNDTDWPLRLPMTKAAARALDTWQAFSTLQIGAPVSDTCQPMIAPHKQGTFSSSSSSTSPSLS